MVDGDPKTAGPSATILSVTSPARVNQAMILRASAPTGTACELRVFGPEVKITPLGSLKGGKGQSIWSWKIRPKYPGRILYEVQCSEQHGSSELVNTTRGNISITNP